MLKFKFGIFQIKLAYYKFTILNSLHVKKLKKPKAKFLIY